MKNKFNVLCISLVISLFSIFALGSGSSDDPATKVDGSNSSKSNSTVSQATVFKVGETIKKGGVQLLVTKVEKSNKIEYNTPKDGSEFVIVYVKIENVDTKNISYNTHEYKLKNSDGQLLPEKSFNSGELAPGGKVEVSLIFETKKDDANLVLQYYSSFFNNDAAIEIKLS